MGKWVSPPPSTLTFTQGANILSFFPAGGGTGTCDLAGTPDSLAYWAEWTSEPYLGRVLFQPSIYAALQFTLSPDGTCKGYQWIGSWVFIGEWDFSSTKP